MLQVGKAGLRNEAAPLRILQPPSYFLVKSTQTTVVLHHMMGLWNQPANLFFLLALLPPPFFGIFPEEKEQMMLLITPLNI